MYRVCARKNKLNDNPYSYTLLSGSYIHNYQYSGWTLKPNHTGIVHVSVFSTTPGLPLPPFDVEPTNGESSFSTMIALAATA